MQNNQNKKEKAAAGGQSGGNGPGTLLDRYTAQPAKGDDKSPYYKSTAPSISLPKGGGALKGIDEKFTVNAVNGTAGLEIALPFTPGRGGFTPTLSLSYNSGSGNSEFGLGWGLSLPAIQRKTDKKLPCYNDAEESDVFLLAGAEDLVPELDENGERIAFTVDNYTVNRYRPRIEGLFARIELIRENGQMDCWWRVTTRDNITTYYGMTVESRVSDPGSDHRIFKWLPDMVVDHKGNVQLYRYVPEDLVGVPDDIQERNRRNGTARIANTYLKRVQYGNVTPYFVDGEFVFEPAMPVTDWLFEAVLDYGDHNEENYDLQPDQNWPARKDAFSDFHAGFEIRTYRRCRRILMFHTFAELNTGEPTLVRSLELGYRNDSIPDGAMETDFIVSATQRGYLKRTDGSWASKALPAMTMEYIPFQWNTEIREVTPDDFAGAPQGLTGPYQWTDFEGEGISGMLTEQGNGWFYKNNLGNGHFAGAKIIAEKPSFTGLGDHLQWQDLDADGRRQVVADGAVKGFWELGDDQRWTPFQAFDKNCSIDWNSPLTKTLDLDGDGRADALITEDRAWTWYANEGKEGHDRGGSAPLFDDEEKGPVLLLRDAVQSIFLADMNGDGMTDLVRIGNGEVCYWPNMGYGRFGAKVSMGNAPVFNSPDQYNPAYLTLADISGTGAADLIYTGQNTCRAWINLSGNAWSDAYDINPLPGTDGYSKIAVLDFLGNGTSCIVWSSPLPQHATAPIQYIDLMGGNKPHLLQRYNNGMGKTVTVEYKSSTHFYLEDKLQGVEWATRLPFPVHCISKITTRDLVSDTRYAQEYRYRHGYYDHEEREFRGFGYVETLDTDTVVTEEQSPVIVLDQHPVKTKTWYHTGAWMREGSLLGAFSMEYFRFEDWALIIPGTAFPEELNAQESREAHRALKGSALRQEIYAVDGTELQDVPYSVTTTAYEVKKVQGLGANRFASFLNLQQQSINLSCERDVEDPRILHELTLQTDEYGNVLQSAQVAYKRKQISAGLPVKVKEEQARMHITCVENTFTEDAIDTTGHAFYRLRLPHETKRFEAVVTHISVEGGFLWTVPRLAAALAAATTVDFSVVPVTGNKRLVGCTRNRYLADDAVTPLPYGQIESLGLPSESHQQVFTPGIISLGYGTRVNPAKLAEGGYVDLDENGNYWLPSGKALYSTPETKFYTPELFTDPWGNETAIAYWNNYWLLPERVTDAKGNIQAVLDYEWRLLQPRKMQDANLNISELLYDALGMPVAMAVKGKDNGTEGDRLDGIDPHDPTDEIYQGLYFTAGTGTANLLKDATWRCVYDLDTLPTAVGMIARQHHFYGAAIPSGQDTAPLRRYSYSDGMGRVLMHKVLVEPDPATPLSLRWVGSGRTIYNNKGNEVMQYEPYFSTTFQCDTTEQAAAAGVSPKLYYDPLNRNRRTDLPDGSFTKTEWTAWEQTTWDNNDTVLQSAWYTARIGGLMGAEEQEAAQKAAAHANTPTVLHTDTLARSFYTIQQDTPTHYIHSHENLDIQGNRLSVVDGRGLTALQYTYNMLQAPVYQQSIDSGMQRTLLDVAGQPLYAWDADDREFRIQYDELRRPLYKWLSGSVLLEKTVYGEGQANPEIHNLRGQVYEHFDGSGRQWMPLGYDFKGSPVEARQQLLSDASLTDANWATLPAPLLDGEEFVSKAAMDALGRPVTTTDPGLNVTTHIYDKGGALKSVQLNGTVYVQDIHYDAKGQRQAIWYGNGTKTSYVYDLYTFRLKRMWTLKPPSSDKYQDLNYYYDPIGNITQIKDEALQTLFFNNAGVSPTQRFTYDALYRLVTAQGRELQSLASFGVSDNWNDALKNTAHPGDSNSLQVYTQQYTYDEVGNILQLQHSADTGSYTRSYHYVSGTNRLSKTTIGTQDYPYQHDNSGNMISMPHLASINWNADNEMSSIDAAGIPTHYQYSGGQRIRKYTDKTSVKEVRIYLGSYEIYRKLDSSGVITLERRTAHISDDTGRIAMLEKRTVGTDPSPAELQRYVYSNHLGSASLEIDEQGRIISYEEYHPYGTTSYQAMNATINAVAKRYRYTGKERDEESGLYYHGARYYAPWLGRWTACDPLESKYAGRASYCYCNNDPIGNTDPNGMEETSRVKPDIKLKLPPGFKAPAPPPPPPAPDKPFDLKPEEKPEQEPEKPNIQPPSPPPPTPPPPPDEQVQNPLPNEPIEQEPLPKPEEPVPSPEKDEESLGEQIADTVLDFVPIIGGIKDIVKGIRNGDGLTVAIGAASILADVLTMGGSSLAKGGVKTLVKAGVKASAKAGVKEGAQIATKEAIRKGITNVAEEGVEHFDDYNKARNAAMEWLEKRGFKAEEKNISTMRLDPNRGKAIGMTDKTGKIGFRIEYGEVMTDGKKVFTPHINVFDKTAKKGFQKGPHFTFPGNQKHVSNIVRKFNR